MIKTCFYVLHWWFSLLNCRFTLYVIVFIITLFWIVYETGHTTNILSSVGMVTLYCIPIFSGYLNPWFVVDCGDGAFFFCNCLATCFLFNYHLTVSYRCSFIPHEPKGSIPCRRNNKISAIVQFWESFFSTALAYQSICVYTFVTYCRKYLHYSRAKAQKHKGNVLMSDIYMYTE